MDNNDIFEACKVSDLEGLKCLVEDYGANINVKDYGGITPLHEVSKLGYTNMVEYLVECGANIDAKDFFGRSPTHDASRRGHLDIVRYFVGECGVDPYDVDDSGI